MVRKEGAERRELRGVKEKRGLRRGIDVRQRRHGNVITNHCMCLSPCARRPVLSPSPSPAQTPLFVFNLLADVLLRLAEREGCGGGGTRQRIIHALKEWKKR